MAEERDAGRIESYHAHIYFDAGSRERAWTLRERIAERFEIEMGRFHEKNVGPHPHWSYLVTFKPELFSEFVPWLMLNRDDLVVLLHPNTDDDLADHRDFPVWMGATAELDLSIFE
jgi:DOPA 4,5-dioxygenase